MVPDGQVDALPSSDGADHLGGSADHRTAFGITVVRGPKRTRQASSFFACSEPDFDVILRAI